MANHGLIKSGCAGSLFVRKHMSDSSGSPPSPAELGIFTDVPTVDFDQELLDQLLAPCSPEGSRWTGDAQPSLLQAGIPSPSATSPATSVGTPAAVQPAPVSTPLPSLHPYAGIFVDHGPFGPSPAFLSGQMPSGVWFKNPGLLGE
jgi:hypothetical protein